MRKPDRPVFRTYSNEPGRMFTTAPEYRGHRPVSEEDVEFYRGMLESGETERELAFARQWIAEYEELTSEK